MDVALCTVFQRHRWLYIQLLLCRIDLGGGEGGLFSRALLPCVLVKTSRSGCWLSRECLYRADTSGMWRVALWRAAWVAQTSGGLEVAFDIQGTKGWVLG
jgi:hypothetical protein